MSDILLADNNSPMDPENNIREKSEGGIPFEMVTEFTPAGDQPQAIAELVQGIEDGDVS